MARPGDVIEVKTSGEKIVFLKTPRETGGELLQMEFFVNPGGFTPPPHIHADVEERVKVLSGRVNVIVGREEWEAGPGESAVFPMGERHGFAAVGDEQLRMLVDVVPPRDFDVLFETVFGFCADGKTDQHGRGPLLSSIPIARHYHTYLPGAPIVLQRLALTLAAPISWLLGYRSRYEKYSGRASERPAPPP
jgi:quercetin dioxygenase-like cupin family protein